MLRIVRKHMDINTPDQHTWCQDMQFTEENWACNVSCMALGVTAKRCHGAGKHGLLMSNRVTLQVVGVMKLLVADMTSGCQGVHD